MHPYSIYPDDEMSIFLMTFHRWGAFATSLIYDVGVKSPRL